MFQPDGKKYQLFPKGGLTGTSKGLDPEQAFAHAISQSPKTEKSDKLSAATNGLRLRIKEHNLTRRRKISVPELGPMTTVQETSMDSRKCFPGEAVILIALGPSTDRGSHHSRTTCSPRAVHQRPGNQLEATPAR